PIDVSQSAELRQLAQQVKATGRPVALTEAGETIAVVQPAPARPQAKDVWAHYDPERARQALRASRGALAGVDRDALLADIHAQRGQKARRGGSPASSRSARPWRCCFKGQ